MELKTYESDKMPPANGHTEVSPTALSAVSLRKTFGRRRVVDDVSLSVDKGEVVGLLGANGAGKTTTFYMLVGLERSETGSIYLQGKQVTTLPMYLRARLGLGYLPQEPSIFRKLTAEQNILAVLETTKASRAERFARLQELLEEFGIDHVRRIRGDALSGGERRRVEIARALATRPNYMLLDEPFAGIDPIAVGDIQDLVRHLTNRGIGVLITDHNVRETLDIVDRACIIYGGQVLFAGSPQELVADENVRRLYLGESFTL
mgnify:CR=1 FL=1